MGLTADDYLAHQQALMPRGAAWARDPASIVAKLLAAKAAEYARVDARGGDLPIEAIPATTYELLADWERVCGLPDPCVGAVEPTVQGRRNAVVGKLAGAGSASIPYFVAVGAALGYAITVEEFRPFCAGVACAGGDLTGGDWLFTWRVHLPSLQITSFRAGVSCAGEALASWGDAMFECRFSGLKPAHTHVLFAYAAGRLLCEDGTVLLSEAGGQILLDPVS